MLSFFFRMFFFVFINFVLFVQQTKQTKQTKRSGLLLKNKKMPIKQKKQKILNKQKYTFITKAFLFFCFLSCYCFILYKTKTFHKKKKQQKVFFYIVSRCLCSLFFSSPYFTLGGWLTEITFIIS